MSAPANCNVSGATWGSGGFCQASSATITHGETLDVINSKTGAIGSATLTCSNGALSVAFPSCSTSITAPGALLATDGTVTGKITVTWAAAPGATGYDVQYRKVGDTTWTLVANASSGWQLPTTDESIYEFQVVGKNSTGQGAWSETETGYIRKKVDPVFVSQSGIPSKIGVGQSFTYSQVWQNNGTETWTGGAHGTGPFSPPNTSVWGTGFVAYAGSTATGATVTTSLTAVAPTTPGTYPLQRIMQKSGVSYGAASSLVNVQVIGSPTCTGMTPDITTTYNKNATVTVTLQGPSSVESAWIKVWTDVGGAASFYPMTLSGSTWTLTYPIASHAIAGVSKIFMEAQVANSLFPAQTACATNEVGFQELPVPVITLTPTVGSFSESGKQGFVVNRLNGNFAGATVSLGAFTNMKAKVEIIDASNNPIASPLTNVIPGTQTALVLPNSTLNSISAAWTSSSAIVRISYADSAAALQGKVAEVPIAWMATPGALQVAVQTNQGLPQVVSGKIQDSEKAYSASAHGQFLGGLRTTGVATEISPFVPANAGGEWASSGLDYALLYNVQMVSVARAVPPAGVTLLQPWEYISAAFLLPVQAPAQITATDGTREDDVAISWTAPATGPSIKYRVFRDEKEITPVVGTADLSIVDVPPERGVIYTYAVKTFIGSTTSDGAATDTGFTPACRAARLVGASLNAEMSAIVGLLERWECLADLTGTAAIDAGPAGALGIDGTTVYRSFSVPVPSSLSDGAHTVRLNLVSDGASLNGSRDYDIPFALNRASISVKGLTILYNGMPATNGVEANSVGRFGIRMEGGSGIGFAEEVK